MKYDAVILDIDGTLWNASPASAAGWNKALESMGIDARVTAEQIETVAGLSYGECVETLLPGMQNKYPALIKTMNMHETEKVEEMGGVFFEGVRKGVEKLSHSYKVFLVSNCQDWYMDAFLGFSGFKDMLSGYDCHGMSGVSKGEMIKRIVRGNGLRRAVYAGDTAGDEKAAKEAGVEYFHMAYGFGEPMGKPVRFDSFAGLVEFL